MLIRVDFVISCLPCGRDVQVHSTLASMRLPWNAVFQEHNKHYLGWKVLRKITYTNARFEYMHQSGRAKSDWAKIMQESFLACAEPKWLLVCMHSLSNPLFQATICSGSEASNLTIVSGYMMVQSRQRLPSSSSGLPACTRCGKGIPL